MAFDSVFGDLCLTDASKAGPEHSAGIGGVGETTYAMPPFRPDDITFPRPDEIASEPSFGASKMVLATRRVLI